MSLSGCSPPATIGRKYPTRPSEASASITPRATADFPLPGSIAVR